jgi:Mn-dependent DtxR family transcriptional regulator
VLLAFAIEFERESDVSLAICANVLRVLDEKGVRTRDIPLLTGVSKESIAMAMGILRKKSVAVVEKNVARLTPKGREAHDEYRRIAVIEESWRSRFGEDTIRALWELLGRSAGKLFRGLDPYADGWRASVRKPNTLPHYPMVLHRGGFPDGS